MNRRTPKMPRHPRRASRYLQMQDDSGFSNDQFESPPPKIPYKSVVLALTLLVVGTVGIVIGSLLKVGIIDSPEWLDKGTPLLILGSICFIPGSYYTYMAYYAWYEYDGYSFANIPDLDD